MRIADVTLAGAEFPWPGGPGPGPLSLRGGRSVDLWGFLVLPGIVDTHGDGFEQHLAPAAGPSPNPPRACPPPRPTGACSCG
jgi:alpha-D-ribose 1-methylphosphonate 5-triphosphate diphosphatase